MFSRIFGSRFVPPVVLLWLSLSALSSGDKWFSGFCLGIASAMMLELSRRGAA